MQVFKKSCSFQNVLFSMSMLLKCRQNGRTDGGCRADREARLFDRCTDVEVTWRGYCQVSVVVRTPETVVILRQRDPIAQTVR